MRKFPCFRKRKGVASFFNVKTYAG